LQWAGKHGILIWYASVIGFRTLRRTDGDVSKWS